MNDLLFGASDLYTWDKIKPWAQSIRDSGFDGEVVLLVYRADMDMFAKEAAKLDIQIMHTDSDNHGRPIDHNAGGRDTQCHQMRFFHLWQFLSADTMDMYDRVITTDVRDVIFQRNPSEWLDDHMTTRWQVVAPSEGILYKNEHWNKDNMLQGFGPYVLEYAKNHTVYNVGTIAAGAEAMRDLALLIFSMAFFGSKVSACRNNKTSPFAFFAPKFICLALPFGELMTLTPSFFATLTVLSLLPPSETIISHLPCLFTLLIAAAILSCFNPDALLLSAPEELLITATKRRKKS